MLNFPAHIIKKDNDAYLVSFPDMENKRFELGFV